MEGGSNGKIEETKIVKGQEAHEKAEVVDSGDKFVREVVVDSNSESVEETIDGNNSSFEVSTSSNVEAEAKEENVQVEDSGILEVMEKEMVNSVVGYPEFAVSVEEKLTETIEASVEKFEKSNEAEVEVKETEEPVSVSKNETDVVGAEVKEHEEKVSVSLNETGVIPPVVKVQTDAEVSEAALNATEGASPAVTEEVSKGIEEKVLQSSDENNVVPPALTEGVSKGIKEEKLGALEENTGESSGNVGKETEESVESTTVVGSSDAFPESTGNPPIISFQQRNMRPSWRSCCGLFEALRRSNR